MAKAGPVPGLHPRASLLENARAIVATRTAEMFHFEYAIGDPDKDEDLHNMRIAAKRLRYTLEMFRVLLKPDGAEIVDTVKELQERIGVIHDADVLTDIAHRRLAVVAQRQVEALVGATATGEDERRGADVRAIATTPNDPRLGLAVLLAHTRAERDHNWDALTGWWAEHGGAAFRGRLDACLE